MVGVFLLGSVRGSISMFILVSFQFFLCEDEGEMGGGAGLWFSGIFGF
jgi:hypothetical protein